MNILMVNPVHPDTPHISAVRAWRFACELAALGHKVVLLTATQQGHSSDSIERIANHEWEQVFIVACDSLNPGAEEQVSLPRPLRKAVTVWRMLRHGGKQGEWSASAERAANRLSARFVPDVVWCTFGMMEAVIAAKRIAASAGCPWILDIKDNWELYVPRGLRRVMAWRTRGWAAVTANARFTADKARLWQKAEARVVYSGVEDTFFARADIDANPNIFCINLVGGIYFADRLESFLAGVGAWEKNLSQEHRSRIVIRYLGGNGQLVAEVAQRCLPSIQVEIMGYVSTDRLAHFCQGAAVNAYIAHPGTFHHKLLELLACGRPLMAYPVETGESRDLARQASGILLEVADAAQVSAALTRLHRSWLDAPAQPSAPDPICRYSWANQAKLLEQALADIVSS